MKNQNKSNKKYYCNKHNFGNLYTPLVRRKLLKFMKWKIIYNKKNRKFRLVKDVGRKTAVDEYVIFSVLNTDVITTLGVAASMIARSILALYNKLKADQAKKPYINEWQKDGENIIVLQGYNHKHLKYLEREAEFAALGKHALSNRWCRSRILLVLSVFGRKGEIEDIFDGLLCLS